MASPSFLPGQTTEAINKRRPHDVEIGRRLNRRQVNRVKIMPAILQSAGPIICQVNFQPTSKPQPLARPLWAPSTTMANSMNISPAPAGNTIDHHAFIQMVAEPDARGPEIADIKSVFLFRAGKRRKVIASQQPYDERLLSIPIAAGTERADEALRAHIVRPDVEPIAAAIDIRNSKPRPDRAFNIASHLRQSRVMLSSVATAASRARFISVRLHLN